MRNQASCLSLSIVLRAKTDNIRMLDAVYQPPYALAIALVTPNVSLLDDDVPIMVTKQ